MMHRSCMLSVRAILIAPVCGVLACALVAAGLRAQDASDSTETPEAQTPEAQTPEAQTPTQPKFDWPLPGTVTVTEHATKNGKTMHMRYQVHVRPREASKDGGPEDSDAKELLVSLRSFEFLKLDDMDLTKPEIREQLAPALALSAAIPDLVIDAHGAYRGTIGMDETIRRVVAELTKNEGGHGDAKAAQMRTALESPSMRATLEASAGQFWDAWVGSWIQWDVPAGKQREQSTKLPLGTFAMPAKLLAQNLGAVDAADAGGNEGYVKLRTVTRASGPEARKAYADYLAQLFATSMKHSPEAKTFDPDKIKEIDIRTSVDVVTRLDNLRPLSASFEKNHVVDVEGQAPQRYLERRVYEFDWKE
ncbi:MAG: hypothetical protein H6832_10380 [Planctomycetes bacterium]|nr:hypothetical protein [Planctomycetota bacterium]